MTATVTDLNAAVASVTADYPSLPAGAGAEIAREISAFQSLYFGRYYTERAVLTAPSPSGASVSLATFGTINGRYLCAEDVLEVYIGGLFLPILPYREFVKTTANCCAFFDGELCLHRASGTAGDLKIVYRAWPAPVTFSSGSYSGSVYIPQAHLPVLFYKIRQTVCALAGEFGEADYFARVYRDSLPEAPAFPPPPAQRSL